MPGEIRDIRMIQKSLEQRWPIRPEYREALVKRLTKIIADPKSTTREVTAASRALIAAEGQNQGDEQHIDDRMDASRNRILTLLEQRGSGIRHLTVDGSRAEQPMEGHRVRQESST